MRVEKLMSRQIATCGPQDSLDHAAGLMWNSDCGCLPVTTGDGSRQIIGMITDRDICMSALFQGKPLRELKVEDAMAKNVLVCATYDQVEDAERKMREEQIRRLPVVDNEGALVGVLSMADIAREAATDEPSHRQRNRASDVVSTLAAISAPVGKPLAA